MTKNKNKSFSDVSESKQNPSQKPYPQKEEHFEKKDKSAAQKHKI